MQEAKINLGKVVRVARKRKRITQDYLAEKVGVQPRTILEIENGRGNPRFENLFQWPLTNSKKIVRSGSCTMPPLLTQTEKEISFSVRLFNSKETTSKTVFS